MKRTLIIKLQIDPEEYGAENTSENVINIAVGIIDGTVDLPDEGFEVECDGTTRKIEVR